MTKHGTFDVERVRARAVRVIAPLKPAYEHSVAPKDMLFLSEEN